MNNFCKNCGTRLKTDAVFCHVCGAKVLDNKNSGFFDMIYDTFLRSEGRLNRWRYFKRYMMLLFIAFVGFFICSSVSDDIEYIPEETFRIILILGAYSKYCLTARRLQDLGGKYFWGVKNKIATIKKIKMMAAISVLLGFVPFESYLVSEPGDVGPNAYGEDPLSQ